MPTPDAQQLSQSNAFENEPWSTPDAEAAELAQKMLDYCALAGLPDADDQSTSAEGDGGSHKVTAMSLQAWMQRQDDLARALLSGQSRMEMVLRDLALRSSDTCSELFQSETPALKPAKTRQLHLGVTGCIPSQKSMTNPLQPPKDKILRSNCTVAATPGPADSVALQNLAGDLDATEHWRRKIRHQQRKKSVSVRAKKSETIMSTNGEKKTLLWRIVHSRATELVCLLLVWLNAIYLGAQVEYQGTNHKEIPLRLECELLFAFLFTAELVLRALADGRVMLFGHDAGWHVFDIIVVLMMWVELAIGALRLDLGGNVSVIRIVRCARIVRVARIIRTLNCFAELRLMILSILRSAIGIVWIAAVLCVFMYVFSVTLTQGALDVCNIKMTDRLDPDMPDTCKYWGSIYWSLLSLYWAMTGGISWGELQDSLQPVGWFYMGIFLLYITLAIFVVANIITGIFVDSAMRAAKQDHQSVIHEEMIKKEESIGAMNKVFRELDVDNDGMLLLSEFERAISNEHMVTYLSTLGLEVADARVLFCLLDRNRSGSVDIEDFIVGCMKLRGEARSLDVAMIQLQSDWLVEAMEVVSARVEQLHVMSYHG